MTLQAMRAAVIAIRAGVFDDADHGRVGGTRTEIAAASASWSPGGRPPWSTGDVAGPAVVVLPAHAGAGASTVALALAEAVATRRSAQLVEYADPARSGLAAATSIELGADESGWRHGRRGQLHIARLARTPPAAGELPPPPRHGDGDQPLVLDAGWPLTVALTDRDHDGWSATGLSVVAVTRVTVPAVRQTERLLAALAQPTWVAAVGPGRWPRAVAASCGPRLRELRADGRLVRFPIEARLESSGPTSDPLPKPVAAAGRSLATLILPSTAPRRQRHVASTLAAATDRP